MYLAELNSEQKELFLALALQLASVDGCFSKDEKRVIEQYCKEMENLFDEEIVLTSWDEIVQKFNSFDNTIIKRIVVFEAIGLAMADNKYDASEKELIKSMAKKFELEESFADDCEKIVKEYISFQSRINELVIKD